MYILGDKLDSTNQIFKLIANTSTDDEQHIIGDVKEIITREPIVFLCSTVDCETVKCVVPYLNDKLPIIFIKQQWSKEELRLIETTIQESLSIRKQLWHDEIKKLSAFQGKKAQEERVKKLDHWIHNATVYYYCLSSSETDFEIKFKKISRCKASNKYTHQLIMAVTQRPAALHWTWLPQSDEAQITFKVTFPQSCFMRSELFELVKRISDVYKWQYQYEWCNGVLFRIEAAKIAVIKFDHETLEISGRIDNAIMDDKFDTMPMKSVWPYLSIALIVAIEYFDELQLQYIIRIIPFGSIFYDESDAHPRAFNLTQVLISNDCMQRVAYQDSEILYHLNLVQLFPGLKPKTISEFSEMKAKNNGFTERDESNLSNDNLLSPLPERIPARSSGRRVSFGTIKCISRPSQKVEPDVELDDVPNEESTMTNYEVMPGTDVDLILDETMK